MNYDQAKELSFLVPWKTSECFSGPDCWCRIILPVEPVLYSHEESPDVEHEYVIVDAGALDKETAEYMVKLHNKHCENEKEIETFEKLWANKHSKIGKIVRKEID